MKRFQMITEADARMLDYGSIVVLVAGGHVTPLAPDTLKARRITVVREGRRSTPSRWRSRRAPIRTVAMAGDHTSLALKAALVHHLRSRGIAAHDLGTDSNEPVDYPDTAAAVAVRWRAARPTPASSSTAPGSARPSPPTRSTASAPPCALNRDAGALCPAAQRRERAGARLHAGHAGRGRRDRGYVHRYADAGAALHPQAGEDPRPRER